MAYPKKEPRLNREELRRALLNKPNESVLIQASDMLHRDALQIRELYLRLSGIRIRLHALEDKVTRLEAKE